MKVKIRFAAATCCILMYSLDLFTELLIISHELLKSA